MRSNSSAFPILVLASLSLFLVSCAKQESGAPVSESEPEEVAELPAEGGNLTSEQQQAVIDEIMRAKAREQAEGLGGGKVEVNGAWNYTGYSYLVPDPEAAIEARLIAVDITVSGHTRSFDIDDIEAVDGASLMSYGSDPHATPLGLDGKPLPPEAGTAEPPKANRWLLIYAYPAKSPALHLYYWGQQLTPEPVVIADRGMELPYPAVVGE